jgi:hypothetical protein
MVLIVVQPTRPILWPVSHKSSRASLFSYFSQIIKMPVKPVSTERAIARVRSFGFWLGRVTNFYFVCCRSICRFMRATAIP